MGFVFSEILQSVFGMLIVNYVFIFLVPQGNVLTYIIHALTHELQCKHLKHEFFQLDYWGYCHYRVGFCEGKPGEFDSILRIFRYY